MKNKENNQSEFRNLFGSLQQLEIEPSENIKYKVIERIEKSKYRKKVTIWQITSAMSFVFVILAGFLLFKQWNRYNKTYLLAGHSYALQLSIDSDESSRVVQVEVELPQDVTFVSSNGPLSGERIVRVAYDKLKLLGAHKIPVVLKSNSPGSKELKLRMLDAQNNLLTEKNVVFDFYSDDRRVWNL